MSRQAEATLLRIPRGAALKVVIPVFLLAALTTAWGAAKPVKAIAIDIAPFSEADRRTVGDVPDEVLQFRDGSGRNLLALKRTESIQLLADSESESLIRLSASLYRRVQPGDSLQQVWEIKDCPVSGLTFLPTSFPKQLPS